MGKTAGCSPAREQRALRKEHPAILPWLYSSVGYAAAPAAIAPREAELPARNWLAANVEAVDQLLITRFVLRLEIVEEAAPL